MPAKQVTPSQRKPETNDRRARGRKKDESQRVKRQSGFSDVSALYLVFACLGRLFGRLFRLIFAGGVLAGGVFASSVFAGWLGGIFTVFGVFSLVGSGIGRSIVVSVLLVVAVR